VYVAVPAEYVCSTQSRSGQKRRAEYINKITIEMKEITPAMRLLVINNHVKHISDGEITSGYNSAHQRWGSIKEEATVSRNVFIIACDTYHGIIQPRHTGFNESLVHQMMSFEKGPDTNDDGNLISQTIFVNRVRGGRCALENCTPNVKQRRLWARTNDAHYKPAFVMAPVTGINANILISGDYPGDLKCFANSIVKRFMLDNTVINHDTRNLILGNAMDYARDYEKTKKSNRDAGYVCGPMAELRKVIDEGHLYDSKTTVRVGNDDYGLVRIGNSQYTRTGKRLLDYVEWDNFVPVIDVFVGAEITSISPYNTRSKIEPGRYVILTTETFDELSGLTKPYEQVPYNRVLHLIHILHAINVKINRRSLRGNTALKSNITKERNAATNDSRVSRRF